ncbi:hypothetical protein [uncultured Maricaulis sp.]|uniref:hypothetical protein n=1 Tax=uncultured Maricaulis sp. TaxID=174710 RepID=UPI0025D6ACD2|nr:hypothetical protein [uncultured Maricaulis sp.]
MSILTPRAVLVTRQTDLDLLIGRHGTLGQVEFFLRSHDREMEPLMGQADAQKRALLTVQRSIPQDWRYIEIDRSDLSRFLFAEGDIVIAIGQDGLIANLAKYAHGKPVVGVNPAPDQIAGLLVAHRADQLRSLLPRVADGAAAVQHRTMVEASLSDGQRLLALNEIFVGHRSHQSARYTLTHAGSIERQSSSGVIIATGTGSTGWARSIIELSGARVSIDPSDTKLAFFPREPWPSPTTGNSLKYGLIKPGEALSLTSEMNESGVVFADGIEDDRLAFDRGLSVSIKRAHETLQLIQPA